MSVEPAPSNEFSSGEFMEGVTRDYEIHKWSANTACISQSEEGDVLVCRRFSTDTVTSMPKVVDS